jgi:hypothetical protein
MPLCWERQDEKPRTYFCNVWVLLLAVVVVVTRQGPGRQPPQAQGSLVVVFARQGPGRRTTIVGTPRRPAAPLFL